MRALCAQHQHGHMTEKQLMSIIKNDPDVRSKFQRDNDDLFFNERMDTEIEKRNKYTESRRKNRKCCTGETHVYLIKNKKNGFTKIGASILPERRVWELKEKDDGLEIIFISPIVSVYKEFDIQKLFKEKQEYNEWYKLSKEDIHMIVHMFDHMGNGNGNGNETINISSKEGANAKEIKGKEIKVKEIDISHRECSTLLQTRILEHRQQKITESTIEDWDDVVRLMVERDKRSIEDIKKLINQCHDMQPNKNGFTWRDNIRSMQTLRMQWNDGKIFIGMNLNTQGSKQQARRGGVAEI